MTASRDYAYRVHARRRGRQRLGFTPGRKLLARFVADIRAGRAILLGESRPGRSTWRVGLPDGRRPSPTARVVYDEARGRIVTALTP